MRNCHVHLNHALTTKTGTVMLSAAKGLSAHRETLRCAQGDKLLPVLVGKIIIGDAGIHGPPTTWPE